MRRHGANCTTTWIQRPTLGGYAGVVEDDYVMHENPMIVAHVVDFLYNPEGPRPCIWGPGAAPGPGRAVVKGTALPGPSKAKGLDRAAQGPLHGPV